MVGWIKTLPEEFAKDADRLARLEKSPKSPAQTCGAISLDGPSSTVLTISLQHGETESTP